MGEMVGWHHQLSGHEFEHTLGDREDREAWCAAVKADKGSVLSMPPGWALKEKSFIRGVTAEKPLRNSSMPSSSVYL